ncbi:URC4/urg3 family protein [Mycobacterium sp. ACS4331]|uniref:URC4/urg3 family protein n=1 Tax=Mycobacterium sp. ACS4331 TaxID=1834121 RepID=UPI0007FE14BE|nr:URC4/urg3 family protein [Mycobacterium sp. ACS4331]OBF11256.1 uracil phosphoribosyltransferase [Mycobacterium sp. ACS4331]
MTATRDLDVLAVQQLRSTAAVRERANFLLERAREGGSRWFVVDDDGLAHAADEVAAETRRRHPDLDIPYHSRWRHFEAGGEDRKALLDTMLADSAPARRAHTWVDLTVVSVLLDAGAGPSWRYRETDTGGVFARSEGLGVASCHAFTAGLFSSDPADPLRCDAAGLRALTVARLAEAFQVTADNPLVGLDGRVALLHRFGDVLARRGEVFGDLGRPGCLYDTFGAELTAHDLLSTVLQLMSDIWPAQNMIGDVPLGDCWRHDAVPGAGPSRGWMPLHKLSQWLTYSLLEPFEWAGAAVRGLDDLTGLAEYRNGGLLLDTAALRLRDPALARRAWAPADELIVEWRALTVALLDRLAPLVRQRLGLDAERLPLARVLEGGTWWAGRKLAQQLRDGLPPLTVDSDGTVF